MSKVIQKLNQFLFHIFSNNCRCFDATCRINSGDQAVDVAFNTLRKYQDPKNCRTFFDTDRLNYSKMIKRNIQSFYEMFLLEDTEDQWILANGLPFTWKNLTAPHSSPCFCDPIQQHADDLMNLLRTAESVRCGISKTKCSFMKPFTPQQIHLFTQCLFWYFRKAIVDNLVSHCYNKAANESMRSLSTMNLPEDLPFDVNYQPLTRSSSARSGWTTDYKRFPSKNLQRSSLFAGGAPPASIFETEKPLRYSLPLRLPPLVKTESLNLRASPNMSRASSAASLRALALSVPSLLQASSTASLTAADGSFENELGCHAVSVGSMNVTSDYDITLYGPCVTKVIQHFNRLFVKFFGKSSGVVFDTNLYGSSFIELPEEISYNNPSSYFYKEVNCSTDPYMEQVYMCVYSPTHLLTERSLKRFNFDETYVTMAVMQQHLFALMKWKLCLKLHLRERSIEPNMTSSYLFSILDVLNKLEMIRYLEVLFAKDDVYVDSPTVRSNFLVETQTVDGITPELINLFEMIRVYFYKKFNTRLPEVRRLSQVSERNDDFSDDDSGEESVEGFDYNDLPFELVRKQDDYAQLLNTISIFNYFGEETYYTRGAFMHVVMSMQTCKGGTFKELSDHDLIDSFIENFADFIMHNGKKKYVLRMRSALESMKNGSNSSIKGKLLELLKIFETKEPLITVESDAATYHKLMVLGSSWIMEVVAAFMGETMRKDPDILLEAVGSIKDTFLFIAQHVKLQRTIA